MIEAFKENELQKEDAAEGGERASLIQLRGVLGHLDFGASFKREGGLTQGRNLPSSQPPREKSRTCRNGIT